MTLYDSYNKLIYIEGFDSEDYQTVDEDFVEEIQDKIEDNLTGQYKYDYDRDINRMDIYMLKTIPNRIGGTDKNDGTEQHICGLSLYRNPADGKVCGMGYFSCSKEEYDKDNMKIYPYRSERRNLVCMSGTDTNNFPDMEKLYQFLIKEYDLDNVKIESMYRDTYIFVNESQFHFNVEDDYSAYRWQSYQEIRKQSKKAFYKENKINFVTEDGIEGRAVITHTADGLALECMGNFYNNGTDLMNDFLILKGEHPFGEDEDFMQYYKNGIKLPKGERVERDVEPEIDYPPFPEEYYAEPEYDI